jgi:hypothetical protein
MASVSNTERPLIAGAKNRLRVPMIPSGMSGAYQPGCRKISETPRTPSRVVSSVTTPMYRAPPLSMPAMR